MSFKANPELIQLVWNKGEPIPGKDPKTHRLDAYGNPIYRYLYGQQTAMGWEIDHRKPVSKGGSNNIRNLQPTQWRENRTKGNTYPYGIESVDPLPVTSLLKPNRKRSRK